MTAFLVTCSSCIFKFSLVLSLNLMRLLLSWLIYLSTFLLFLKAEDLRWQQIKKVNIFFSPCTLRQKNPPHRFYTLYANLSIHVTDTKYTKQFSKYSYIQIFVYWVVNLIHRSVFLMQPSKNYSLHEEANRIWQCSCPLCQQVKEVRWAIRARFSLLLMYTVWVCFPVCISLFSNTFLNIMVSCNARWSGELADESKHLFKQLNLNILSISLSFPVPISLTHTHIYTVHSRAYGRHRSKPHF